MRSLLSSLTLALVLLAAWPGRSTAQGPVEGQPLGENVKRLLKALDFLGNRLPADTAKALSAAAEARDAAKLQELLDPHVLIVVTLNPEARVKAAGGPAKVALQQSGYVPVIIKVQNDSTV